MSELLTSFVNFFQANPIAQTIGFVAVAVNIIAFVSAKDKKFLIFMAISSGIWGIHFGLMGLLSAMGTSFFDIIKNLVALKYKRNKKIMIGFLIAYLVIGICTFDSASYFSIIPIINALLSIYFIFYFKGAKLKIGFLFILLLWFIYNFTGHSLGGMLSDGILFISGIVGLFRILRGRTKNKEFKG